MMNDKQEVTCKRLESAGWEIEEGRGRVYAERFTTGQDDCISVVDACYVGEDGVIRWVET